MSIGSPRITIRLPQALIDDIALAVKRRDEAPNATRKWTATEWIAEAIVDKLNHEARSAKKDRKARQDGAGENEPRKYVVTGEDAEWYSGGGGGDEQ